MIPVAHRLAFAVLAGAASAALAQGDLSVICSVPIAWCEATAAAFLRDTGIRVKLAQMGGAESLAQIAAERADPKHDVWYAGNGDLHLEAAESRLTDAYKSPQLPQLHDWAVRQAEQSKWHTVGVFAGIVGIGYNADVLAKKGLPEPRCWADLAEAAYHGQIQMPGPGASGVTYAAIATLVQVFGENRAFALLKAMHRNTGNYPRTDIGAIRAAARGETAIAITFLHDGATEIANGFPIRLIAPCEGTGYELGSMSIIKGAPNPESAKKFYDWALMPGAQGIGGEARHFQTPSNRATPLPPGAPTLHDIELVRYDFATYGSSAERARLLEKWEREVHSTPQ